MSRYESRYPTFNVMAEQEHWDEHTRQIVQQRTNLVTFKNLKEFEADTLNQLCALLLDETREPILHFVMSHFDNKLSSNIGEGQRKKGIPPESVLIRDGLQAFSKFCRTAHGSDFTQLDRNIQRDTITQLIAPSSPPLETVNGPLPAAELMTKILTEAVSAYYSHPAIWSEIGYAGPAYPRGYVRTERGLTDPWEAKQQNA